MKEQTIFPREEKAEVLFQKILNDHWACEKLQETFCNCLFCNDDSDAGISPAEFSLALFEPGPVGLPYGHMSEYIV